MEIQYGNDHKPVQNYKIWDPSPITARSYVASILIRSGNIKQANSGWILWICKWVETANSVFFFLNNVVVITNEYNNNLQKVDKKVWHVGPTRPDLFLLKLPKPLISKLLLSVGTRWYRRKCWWMIPHVRIHKIVFVTYLCNQW